jgi:hypothetical protein
MRSLVSCDDLVRFHPGVHHGAAIPKAERDEPSQMKDNSLTHS